MNIGLISTAHEQNYIVRPSLRKCRSIFLIKKIIFKIKGFENGVGLWCGGNATPY